MRVRQARGRRGAASTTRSVSGGAVLTLEVSERPGGLLTHSDGFPGSSLVAGGFCRTRHGGVWPRRGTSPVAPEGAEGSSSPRAATAGGASGPRYPGAASRAHREQSMPFELKEVLRARHGENFRLQAQYMNPQLARVLKTLGFDRYYVRGEGCYLYDAEGRRYLDFLSGFGVFALGRGHPGHDPGPPPGPRPRPAQPGPDRLRAAARAPGRGAGRRGRTPASSGSSSATRGPRPSSRPSSSPGPPPSGTGSSTATTPSTG